MAAPRPEPDRSWTVPAELAEVSRLVLEAAEFLRGHGVGERTLFAAQLLLEETVGNVVRHGYGGDVPTSSEGAVRVRVEVAPESVALAVEDEGPAFDPLREAPPADVTSSLEDRPIGGLGLHLVKVYASDARYLRVGATNRLELRLDRGAS